MVNYIETWLHGEEEAPKTLPISARVSIETVAHLEQLMSTFGISKTEAIQGALDTGLKELLNEADRIFTKGASSDGKQDYLDEKADFEKYHGGK
jgi:hypothetical protein